jgi:hypothetical protein
MVLQVQILRMAQVSFATSEFTHLQQQPPRDSKYASTLGFSRVILLQEPLFECPELALTNR